MNEWREPGSIVRRMFQMAAVAPACDCAAGRASPSSPVVTSHWLSRQCVWEAQGQAVSGRLERGEVWVSVGYGVSEYTLVFQRTAGRKTNKTDREWLIVRPAQERRSPARQTGAASVAEVFAVPICSALALDAAAYERFLRNSGVLDDILALLAQVAVRSTDEAETTRRQIQALVMAAEVQHIVERMPA